MTVHLPWRHETELAAEASSVRRARSFVTGHLLDHDLEDLVDDVRLVVSEFATNAIVHARTPFSVVLGASPGIVLLEVLDGTRVGPVLGTAPELETSGRGLAIVEAVCREWGVIAQVSGGKSVWAAFDVDGGSG